MTMEEFDIQMAAYRKQLDNMIAFDMNNYSNRNNFERDFKLWQDQVSKLQYDYMNGVIASYNANTKEKEVIVNLLIYATRESQSGNAIVYVESKDLAEKVEDIIWDEIGDYLLDYEIYEEDSKWVIDCMFAGNYIPYWDGWLD